MKAFIIIPKFMWPRVANCSDGCYLRVDRNSGLPAFLTCNILYLLVKTTIDIF